MKKKEVNLQSIRTVIVLRNRQMAIMNQRIVILLAAVLLLGACSNRETQTPEEAVSVRTVKVEAGALSVNKSFMGVIEEEDGANVTFGVLGTVIRVMVDEGQFVRKGQAMAETDGQNVRHAYEMSASTLSQTEDAYRRMKDLYDKGTLPEIRMVEMEAMLTKARAAEAMSRKNVEDIVLRAPFDGYVAQNAVHEGSSVMPGVTGFKLVKIDKVKVSLSVPEKEIGKVEVGSDVKFTVPALGDSVFTGRVVNKGVVASLINHTYTVKALVENRSHTLLPGMVCKVQMKDVSAEYAILVPQDAIQISGKEKFVWMVRQGRAHRQAVTTGEIYSSGVVIETGLTSGDVIITQGQNKVSEGMMVEEI